MSILHKGRKEVSLKRERCIDCVFLGVFYLQFIDYLLEYFVIKDL